MFDDAYAIQRILPIRCQVGSENKRFSLRAKQRPYLFFIWLGFAAWIHRIEMETVECDDDIFVFRHGFFILSTHVPLP